MNSADLIEEVSGTILEEAYAADVILAALNRGQLACASRLLIPGLADGLGTVSTTTDSNAVDMPDDFHRELFAASINGDQIKIYDNKALLQVDMGHDLTRAGDAVSCCVAGLSIFYMDRPATVTPINLSYYRKPVPMTESSSSFPDGFQGENDLYDSALIAYACWKLFAQIEQGLEGNKTDTVYYKNEFEQALVDLSRSVSEGRPHRKPTVCRTHW